VNSSSARPAAVAVSADTLEAHVTATLARLAATCDARRLLVAWSGGCDSTALLHLALAHARRHRLAIVAVHVDHALLPESAHWASHCTGYAARLGVPCVTRRLGTAPPVGASIEAWAREQRYAELAALTDATTLVLTAHHRDDQGETVLQRVLEGAGPHGLAGMRELRLLGAGHLGRPLLACGRDTLLRWATARGLCWVEDASNVDARFRRNRLRHEVLPLLASVVPGAVTGLLRLGGIQAAVAEGLDQLADALLDAAARPPWRIPIATLHAAGPQWGPFVLRRALVRAGCAPPGRRQLEEILVSACTARGDATPVVRWGAHAVRRYRGELYVTPAELPPTPSGVVAWSPDVPLNLSAGTLRARPGGALALDAARLRAGEVTVRFRDGGERCRPHGSAHRRSLKHLFQDWGVPPWERARTPLVFVDGELAAVAGHCVCAGYAATAAGAAGLALDWTPAAAR
jgi:tRNA(Ile)-lysidine synthase